MNKVPIKRQSAKSKVGVARRTTKKSSKAKPVNIRARKPVSRANVKQPKITRAVGRRKTAVARVRRVPGGIGSIVINGLPLDKYFHRPDLQYIVRQPIELVAKDERFDYQAKVSGGGSHSQAEAIRHGISRLLLSTNSAWRPTLKREGLLKRDSRVKERKKPGLHRARRAPQWQKR